MFPNQFNTPQILKVPTNRNALFVALVPLLIVVLLIGGLFWQVSKNAGVDTQSVVQSVDLQELLSLEHADLDISDAQQLVVNGELRRQWCFCAWQCG